MQLHQDLLSKFKEKKALDKYNLRHNILLSVFHINL